MNDRCLVQLSRRKLMLLDLVRRNKMIGLEEPKQRTYL